MLRIDIVFANIPRVQRLGEHHDVKVGDAVEVTVLLDLGVLFDNNDSVLEDSFVDSLLYGSWNKNHLETKPIKYRLADRDFFSGIFVLLRFPGIFSSVVKINAV